MQNTPGKVDPNCNNVQNSLTISGTKFIDMNGNGRQDCNEFGLPYVTIKLFNDKGKLISQTTTGRMGNYEFNRLAAGTYTVTEVIPPGYINTTPSSVVVNLAVKYKKVTVDFGNALPATIKGLKYNDSNGNGKFNKGEPGLSGWTVQLTDPHGIVTTTVTDNNGRFQFAHLAPGTYTISEVLQPGYTNTSRISRQVKLTSGEVLNVTTQFGLFGNVPVTTAHKYAYIVNDGSNNVTVIDTATSPATVVTSIPVGEQPWDAAITPDGSRVYVTNQGFIPTVPGSVSVIDAATNAVIATIPTGNGTTDIAITPDGTKAYVTNQADNTVSAIDTTTNTVIGSPIPVDFSPFGVAITPDSTKAYVTDSFFNETDFTLVGNISIIDTATNTVISHINLGTTTPEGIAITPDGTKAYVANFGLGFSEPSSVSVIDLATNTVSATIPIGTFNNSKNVAITPDSTKAYVTNNGAGTVSVIDTATNTVIATIPVGPNPNDIAITPDGTTAYVTIGTDNTVVKIDIATNQVTGSPIPVGSEPQGIAINPDP